jgi:hypothetical protein
MFPLFSFGVKTQERFGFTGDNSKAKRHDLPKRRCRFLSCFGIRPVIENFFFSGTGDPSRMLK